MPPILLATVLICGQFTDTPPPPVEAFDAEYPPPAPLGQTSAPPVASTSRATLTQTAGCQCGCGKASCQCGQVASSRVTPRSHAKRAVVRHEVPMTAIVTETVRTPTYRVRTRIKRRD